MRSKRNVNGALEAESLSGLLPCAARRASCAAALQLRVGLFYFLALGW